ncbi:hypothetical protein AB837_00547 [bacterium AB1]|nr:hypothetical protein AB837_00547 [bacterium AB1]
MLLLKTGILERKLHIQRKEPKTLKQKESHKLSIDEIVNKKKEFLKEVSLKLTQTLKQKNSLNNESMILFFDEILTQYKENYFSEYSKEQKLDKILQVRDIILKTDFSKHKNYKEKLIRIVNEEFIQDEGSQQIQKEKIIKKIERLLYKYKFSPMHEHHYLEKRFKKQLKKLINKYGFSASEATLFKITSFAKEINQYVQCFIQDKVNFEFESKRDCGLKKFDNAVFSIISSHKFGEIVSKFRDKNKNKFDQSFVDKVLDIVHSDIFNLNKLTVIISNFVDNYLLNNVSDKDLKEFNANREVVFVITFLFDLCICINEKSIFVYEEDICNLFNCEIIE